MFNEELDKIYTVLKAIKESDSKQKSPIPIFSFEGLPGVGKTTQIELVANEISKKYGKTYYIDLPTGSEIGKLLKNLYSSKEGWNKIRKDSPWINPILISADLMLAVDKGIKEGAKYIFMSRGILSTFYYNLDAYNLDETEAWEVMKEHLKGFYEPNLIIFLDLPEEVAHERVIERNRGPLREMDKIEQMKKDKARLLSYLNKLSDIPVKYIDATGTREEVTQKIVSGLEEYIKNYE